MPTQISHVVFNPTDNTLLTPQKDDNLVIEPEYYMSILPLVLVDGAEGIGTGSDSIFLQSYNEKFYLQYF